MPVTTNPQIEAVKAEFGRAKERMTRALANTPDDKLNWSPSSTARTPIEQVAHAALSIKGMQDWFSGVPFPFSDMQELDSWLRVKEKEFKTRDQALGLLEDNSNEYVSWLDNLTPEQIDSTLHTGFGDYPMAVAVTFVADHIRGHTAQIEYIQTIYGDHDWHIS